MAFLLAAGSLLFTAKSWNSIFYSDLLMAGLALLCFTISFALQFAGKLKEVRPTQRLILLPLFTGILMCAALPLVNIAIFNNTGDTYEYRAEISLVSVIKVQRTGNSSFQCTYTAHWWDARHEKYLSACTSKTVYEQYNKKQPLTFLVKASSHFKENAVRVLAAYPA
jgi:hypothetical protein